MKIAKLVCVFGLLLAINSLNAQKYIHSYVTDRKFSHPEDLFGYTFIPGEMEFTDGDKESLDAGEIVFKTTYQQLKVRGMRQYEGNYSVISTNAVKYGYIMKLMDARNPIDQGHLKFVLDDNDNVDALIFKKSRETQEIIFYQEKISSRKSEQEEKYFSDRGEIMLLEADSIWGETIKPFFRSSRTEQDRIEMKDSISIQFIEDIVVKTKEKPEEEEEEEETVFENTEPTLEEEDDPFNEDMEEDEDDSDPFAGRIKKKKKEKPVEEVVEEVIEEVEPEVVEVEEMGTDGEEMMEEGGKKSKRLKEEKDPKVKEKREYKIVVRFTRWEGKGDEAYQKEVKLEYPIKSWKKRTSPDPNDKDTRHLMEFSSKPNSILVYLDENDTISQIEIGTVTYYLRGF